MIKKPKNLKKKTRKKILKQKNEDLTDYTVNNEITRLILLLDRLYKEIEKYEAFDSKKDIWNIYEKMVSASIHIERTWDTKIQTFIENFIGRRFRG